MPSVDKTRANGKEQNPFLRILRRPLGNKSVQGRLADRVRDSKLHIILANQGQVSHAGGDGDGFLCLALENQRQIRREEVVVSDDVDTKLLKEVRLQLLR